MPPVHASLAWSLYLRKYPHLSRRNRSLRPPHRASIRASRYGLGERQRMDASKLINGSKAEVLTKRSTPVPKSDQPSAVRSEAKKVDKRSTGKKGRTERPQVKAIRKSKSEKLVCRYCGSDDLAPSFIKRRDRRCRKCFSKRYGSAARTRKTKVKK